HFQLNDPDQSFCQSRKRDNGFPLLNCQSSTYQNDLASFSTSAASLERHYWRGPAFAIESRWIERLAPSPHDQEIEISLHFYKDAAATLTFPASQCVWQ